MTTLAATSIHGRRGARYGRAVLAGLMLLGAGAAAAPPAAEAQETEAALVARARAIHERVLTIDTHDDIPLDFATADVDPGVRGTRQVDLPKMGAGSTPLSSSSTSGRRRGRRRTRRRRRRTR